MVDLMIQMMLPRQTLQVQKMELHKKKQILQKKRERSRQPPVSWRLPEADRDKQYADMKKRIQYIYENGGNEAWLNMLSGADSITSLLNKVEYAQSMHGL